MVVLVVDHTMHSDNQPANCFQKIQLWSVLNIGIQVVVHSSMFVNTETTCTDIGYTHSSLILSLAGVTTPSVMLKKCA